MNGHNVWSSLRSKSPFKLWCRHHSFWGSNLVHSVGPRFETRSWQCFRSTFFFLSGIFSLSPVWFWQSVPVQCLVTVQSSWCHRWFCPLGAEIFFLFGDFIGIFFLVWLVWVDGSRSILRVISADLYYGHWLVYLHFIFGILFEFAQPSALLGFRVESLFSF
jgi:hypothetical protein